MNRILAVSVMLVLFLITNAFALESQEFRIREDFGTEPLYDCYLNYFYYTPCPTYSWFWSFEGWEQDDIVGAFFQVGDISMATGTHSCAACRTKS